MADQPLGAPGPRVRATLKRICAGGALSGDDIDTVIPLLPDPKDDFILELAVEGRVDFLLTFNVRDFGDAERFGVRVISPREFLAIIGEA
jgi:hypothetical protein